MIDVVAKTRHKQQERFDVTGYIHQHKQTSLIRHIKCRLTDCIQPVSGLTLLTKRQEGYKGKVCRTPTGYRRGAHLPF